LVFAEEDFVSKVLKIAGIALGALVAMVVAALVYFELTYKKDFSGVPLPPIVASQDPEVIRQGEYLVNSFAHCQACHQQHEFAHERKPNPDMKDFGAGYEMVAGPFGTFRPANLSSHPEFGIGKMSDGQLARAIRHGVDRNGRLAPMMSLAVGNMSNEDLTAVVSYLRTLPPKATPVAPDEWGIIAKVLAGSFTPHDEPPIAHVPPGGVSIERGRYLANGPGFCYGCHTALDMSTFKLTGARFSGEPTAEPDPFDPASEFVVPNLTPDKETGWIARWTEDAFVVRFKQGGRIYKGSKMPWENYARATEDDLRSVYRYLMSLPPTKKMTGPSHRKAGWKPT
jgi:mono/diheme cytochrome c family protein